MSIEKLIEENTKAVEVLTAAIRDLIAGMRNQPQAPAALSVVPEKAPETLAVVPEKAPETLSVVLPSLATLQQDCLQIVRAKPEMKQPIKDLIASFGGAKLLKDIPEKDLPEFARMLEEVK